MLPLAKCSFEHAEGGTIHEVDDGVMIMSCLDKGQILRHFGLNKNA
jgi:hypothetical protein